MVGIPASTLAELEIQAQDDPQVPRLNPTSSFWQLPPHPTISEVRSEDLPTTTEYAIIGSGITGCSIAKTLLALSPPSESSTLTVFEARTLTSGATGRNGGLLSSFVPGDYKLLSERFGHEQATKIGRFANRTLEKMHELANSSEEAFKTSEARKTSEVVCFHDEEAFSEALESLRLYEDHIPEEQGRAQILSAQDAKSIYNFKDSVGAIVYPQNGAFWPYRLITTIWAQMYEQNRSRLSIETKTPVTEIVYDRGSNESHPYILHTPRGSVRASQVIHATNGYTGHLLPNLRGKIYPLRGTMSTQKAPEEFGRHGSKVTWSVVSSGSFDSTANVIDLGLYYANQNPKSGDIFIGGEKAKINELLSSDDSEVGEPCRENLGSLLPKLFARGWKESEKPEVIKMWSGIMGFTTDRLPLIGPLPQRIADRGIESGEWIAAGFNGYGVSLCWSAGEAVAKMLLGMDVSEFLPEVFLATEERLGNNQRMAIGPALELIFGGHP